MKMIDLVEKIIALSGTKGVRPDIQGKEASYGEINRQWLDATKAKEVLGWEPLVGLEEGLSRTIEWFREALAENSGTAIRDF
jgi:CDP-glucose 4,6-dehydratase